MSVVGFDMQDISVPLCKVMLQSELMSGEGAVGVHPGFLIKGKAFLMENNIAEGRVLVMIEVAMFPLRLRCKNILQASRMGFTSPSCCLKEFTFSCVFDTAH